MRHEFYELENRRWSGQYRTVPQVRSHPGGVLARPALFDRHCLYPKEQEIIVSIGAGILLVVIGAILRFALTVQLSWIDLPLVGNIMMAAGVVVAVLGLIVTFRRRRSTSTRRTVVSPTEGDEVVRRTDRIDDAGL